MRRPSPPFLGRARERRLALRLPHADAGGVGTPGRLSSASCGRAGARRPWPQSCEAERAARRDGDEDSGSGNSGSGNSGSGSGNSGSGSSSSPTGEGDGSNSGPGANSGHGREGDRHRDVACGREVLVPGVRVDEAELQSTPSGAVFTEVELDR